MGPRDLVAQLFSNIVGAAANRLGFVRGPGVNWHWPSMGNGDRGPPGSWQMGTHGPGSEELTAFSAVYACVNVISADIAKLPVQVFQTDLKTGAKIAKPADYYVALFREPNSYQTCADFLQLYVMSFLLRGNAYAYCRRNGRGEVSEMHILDPRTTQPLIAQDGSGEVFYRVGTNLLAGIQPGDVIPERNIIHHRLPLMPAWPLVGVTPIYAAAASSAVGLRILANSQKFFANASRPSGTLTSPNRVGKDVIASLKTEFESEYSGDKFGKIAVLQQGLKWEPMTITAQDAQLIEQLRWSVEDVSRVFRVPPFMLGEMSKVSYRNTEQLNRAYLSGCLQWHLSALEQRFARAFDFPIDYAIAFDLTAMLRTEIDIRFDAYGKSLASGWQTINEVRAQEGKEPVQGGDEPLVQVQYVPLSSVLDGSTKPGTPPPPPEPPPAPPGPPESSIEPDKTRVRALLRRKLNGEPAHATR